MKQDINKRLLLLLSLLIMISVPIYWFSQYGKFPNYSLIEGELSIFPYLNFQGLKTSIKWVIQGKAAESKEFFLQQFIARTYQEKFESAATDQFPLRIEFVKAAKAVDRGLIWVTYAFLPDSAIPTDMSSGCYITRDGEIFLDYRGVFDEKTRKMIDKRITNYSELIRLYPNQNFYVYYHELIRFSKFDPRTPFFADSDSGRAFEYFEQHKPEGLTLGKFMLTSLEDQNKYYYRTDHHWNIRGAWKAYQGIYEMVVVDYPEISPQLELISFNEIPGLRMIGSNVRRTLYPIGPEKFEVAEVNLPNYVVLEDGKEIKYNQRTEYLAGNFNPDPYSGHYGSFFGGNVPIVEYVFNNNAPKNLLLIGNSFKPPLQPYIASHYQHTYVVHLQEYYEKENKEFSLGEFLKQHSVDDVILLEDASQFTLKKWNLKP